jgi:hypothetical protein
MNMYGNTKGEHGWTCTNCLRIDIGESEMCECWDQLDTVECDVCGNVWDGHAQCTCLMLGEASDYDSSSFEDDVLDDKDNDTLSVNSDASDILVDFEETGHIPMDTTRDSIKQMLVIARSQMETGEDPEWMDEKCDEVLAGNFTSDGYFVPRKTEKSTKKILEEYPMLTETELTELYEQLGNEQIEDIVDMLNMRRMREYESARVYHIHWPAWVVGEQPELQLVKRV